MRESITENFTENFQEDIESTLKIILQSSTNNISNVFFCAFKNIDHNIKKSIKTEELKIKLQETLNPITIKKLNKEYFKLFSPETQSFIKNYLSNGVQGTLNINIDDSLRGGPNSNVELIIYIQGYDIYGDDANELEEFYYTFRCKSIKDIEKICSELSNFHYLGLGLDDGIFKAIKLNKPKRSHVIQQKDDKSNTKKNTERKFKKTKIDIIYPIKKSREK